MTRTTVLSDLRDAREPTEPGIVDGDATVIEVARFRRTELPLPPQEVEDSFAEEPTLIVRAPIAETPVSRPLALGEVFAEPPALPPAPIAASTETAPHPRARRKRLLMLSFVVLAGAWVTLRPQSGPAPLVTSRVLDVQPAAARRPAARMPVLEPPEQVDLQIAAAALASSRYPEALAQYRKLAEQHPDQPVYALIASILRSELRDRCARGAQEACQ